MRRPLTLLLIALALALPAQAQIGLPAGLPQLGAGSAPAASPCDVYSSNGYTCVAAYSVTRRMYAAYSGSLFRLQRTSDNATLDVGSSVGSRAVDTSSVSTFCALTTCNFVILYDQSGHGNSLSGTVPYGTYQITAALSWPVINTSNTTTYELQNRGSTSGIPTGNNPITVYDVVAVDGPSRCCGVFGNVETGPIIGGHMFSIGRVDGETQTGPGIDWESGGASSNLSSTAQIQSIFAKLDTGLNKVVMYAAGLPSGTMTSQLNTTPAFTMNMDGALNLGAGGDHSAGAIQFFEGAILAATTTLTADTAVNSSSLAPFYPAYNLSGASPAYPGDSATAAGWWGLRAYSTASRGNRLANICNPSDVACADIYSDAATGKVVIPTIGGQNCASVTCTVKTLYDLTGNGRDMSQATIAYRPTLVANCIGTQWCMAMGASTVLTSSYSGLAQPFTVVAMTRRTSAGTNFGFLANSGNVNGSFHWRLPGQIDDYGYGDVFLNAVEGQWAGFALAQFSTTHARGFIGGITVDVSTSALWGGSALCIGNWQCAASGNGSGQFTEIGVFASQLSDAQMQGVITGQHGFWGY